MICRIHLMLEKVDKVDFAVLKKQSRFLNECLFYFIFLRPQSIKEAKKTQQEAKKKKKFYSITDVGVYLKKMQLNKWE